MKVEYDYSEIVGMLDSTLLKPDATANEIKSLCREAAEYGFKAVTVNPCYVKLAKKQLKNTSVKVCAVAGFPFGGQTPKVKKYEVKRAFKDGADEADVVMCVAMAKAGKWDYVRDEVKAVVKAAKKNVIKIILETSYLNAEEIAAACAACVRGGAKFVETSTGFAGGADSETVSAMTRAVKEELKRPEYKDDVKSCGVKASGGVKTYAQAKELAEAGALRIGSSCAAAIAAEARKAGSSPKGETSSKKGGSDKKDDSDGKTE